MSAGQDRSLFVAVAKGTVEEVSALLDSGKVEVNLADFDGRRALHMAARRGNADIVNALLAANADVGAVDAYKKDALHEAHEDSIKKILLGARNNKGSSNKNNADSNAAAGGADDEKSESSADYLREDGVVRKGIILLLMPFLILLVVNGLGFAAKFIIATVVFYFIVAGYIVAQIAILPPWYAHCPGSSLPMHDMPDYWRYYHNPKKDLGIPYEDVEFGSTHGYVLRGWYIKGTNPDMPTCIFVHGGGRDRRAWLRHVPMFYTRGYSILLFDYREHGISSGSKRGLTFGMYERFDVVAASKFVREQRGAKKVVAIGTSVGGSSVIMGAAIDPTIDMVISENPVLTAANCLESHIHNLLGNYLTGSKIGHLAYRAFVRCSCSWLNWGIGNKPSKGCQSMHSIPKLAGRPFFVMTGTFDNVVPMESTKKLYELASAPKGMWICDEAFHCCLYDKEPEEWEKRVIGFIEENIDKPRGGSFSNSNSPSSPSRSETPKKRR